MALQAATSTVVHRGISAHLLDYLIPAAILLAVLVVMAPVPAAVVDVMLAANLTLAVLALLGSLAAKTPIEMSIFPTFLLGATLVRLVLNIATTRLILTRAAVEGTSAAGQVVEAFGEFVAANNLIVGAVIFSIIAVIQFVVITAGSTRTSEVAARFTLDGLPGRQMAIDNEVQAGTITREDARAMRNDLQKHADFFASMDGASRFIRGEAIASVIITGVNVVGGLIVGVTQHGMPVQKAANVFSRLTIGDGLATAIPALLISIAMGLLVSRSSTAVDLSREFGRQFASRPHVLAITALFLGLLSFSDLPRIPLLVMAAITLSGAWFTHRRKRQLSKQVALVSDSKNSRATALTEAVLASTNIEVEFGSELVYLVAEQSRQGATHGIHGAVSGIRDRIAGDLGFLSPPVRFRDNHNLSERTLRICIAGDTVYESSIPPARWFVVPHETVSNSLDGEDGTDPLSLQHGKWVGQAQAEAQKQQGASVFGIGEVVIRCIEASIRQHAHRLLTRDAVSRLIESLRKTQPTVVGQINSESLSLARIHRTLQSLLKENVPIRPLSELIEVMTDLTDGTSRVEQDIFVERIRHHFSHTICNRLRDSDGKLCIIRFGSSALDVLRDGVPPSALIAHVRRARRPKLERGTSPVLVVPGHMRSQVFLALNRHLPGITVLAEEEVAQEMAIEVFTTIEGEEVSRAA